MIKLLFTYLIGNKDELLKFILVGTILFFISNLIYILLNKIFNVNIYLSYSIAYILSIFIHYILNKNYTYDSKKLSHKIFIKYIFYLIFNYILGMSLSFFFINILIFNELYLFFYTTPFTMVSSFMLMKYFVFRG
jgi:putative flippase GtrA